MEKLLIMATKSTPKIEFNPSYGILIIKGESYPENAFKFYEPIYKWLEKYLKLIEGEINIEISLTYLNTSSTKAMMNIIDLLEEAYELGKDIILNWYYDEENESLFEVAQEFKEELKMPFNIIPEKI